MAKYIKRDCEKGYVEDVLQIEYLKFNNLRHSVLGFMLGDFDKYGNYVIDLQIKEELIKMPKFFIESFDNIEIFTSALKLDKQITFMITYEGEKVTLSLVEKLNYQANYKLNSGTYSNINEYVLDQVITSGVVDKNVIYRRWNINPYGGQVLDVFNMDEETLLIYAGIVGRFKYLLNANKVLLDKEQELEEIEAEYTASILKTISHYPELKKVFNAQFKATLNTNKDFLKKDKPNFYKTLNEVVDNVIESNLKVLDEKSLEQFQAEKKSALQIINVKRDKVLNLQSSTYETQQIDVRQLQNNSLEQSAKEFVASEQSAIKFIATNDAKKRQTATSEYVDQYLKSIGVEVGVKQTSEKTETVNESSATQQNKTSVKTASGQAPEKTKTQGGGNKTTGGKTTGGKTGNSQNKSKQKAQTDKTAQQTNYETDYSYSRGGSTGKQNLVEKAANGRGANRQDTNNNTKVIGVGTQITEEASMETVMEQFGEDKVKVIEEEGRKVKVIGEEGRKVNVIGEEGKIVKDESTQERLIESVEHENNNDNENVNDLNN